MSSILHVDARSTRGKRHARRMRSSGRIPAILYGHGEPAASLSIAAEEFAPLLRHHVRVFELDGAVKGSAFLREVQYDTFGTHVLHVDLTRVSADESVEVTLSISLRGEAPGTHHGGMLEQPLHEVTIRCPIANIPEQLVLNVSHLELNKTLTVADLELPTGATPVSPSDSIIVTCRIPHVSAEIAAETGAVEPEVIGGAKKEAEETKEATTKSGR